MPQIKTVSDIAPQSWQVRHRSLSPITAKEQSFGCQESKIKDIVAKQINPLIVSLIAESGIDQHLGFLLEGIVVTKKRCPN
ncbi:MAG: hypothetical protein AAFR24_21120 [Cyanobacteria bacterium J06627_3]